MVKVYRQYICIKRNKYVKKFTLTSNEDTLILDISNSR